MQESNTAAQNKLGELFVEFGSKGLGGLMTGLNGISAQFLLTKNAAEQAIKPIWNMSKRVSGSIVEFNKLNSVTGLSVSHLMNMKKWADLNSIDFNDYIGNLKSLQQAMANALINRDPQTLQGFAMLGISPDQLDFKNPEKMISLIASKIKGLDPVMRTVALSMVGLSEDMVYALSKANKQVDKNLYLNKEQIRNTNEVNDAFHELGVTWDTVGQTIIGNWEGLDGIIKAVNDKIKKFIEFLNANPEKKITIIADFIDNFRENFKHFGKGFENKHQAAAARMGYDKHYKDYNILGKGIYNLTKAGQYVNVGIRQATGEDITLKKAQQQERAKFMKQQNITPQTVQQNANKPNQYIGQIGNKQNSVVNNVSFVIHAAADILTDPLGIERLFTKQALNALADGSQAYETRFGSGT